MGSIRFGGSDEVVRRAVEEAMEKTVIHRPQHELAVGRWDFVVFGPDGKGAATARVCVAEQGLIRQAPVYLAALGESGHGVTLGELTDDDCDPKMADLTIESIAPWRPIEIVSRRHDADLDPLRDRIFAEFEGANMGLVETPDEKVWGISAFRYLAECDEAFPDPVMRTIRSTMRSRPNPRFN